MQGSRDRATVRTSFGNDESQGTCLPGRVSTTVCAGNGPCGSYSPRYAALDSCWRCSGFLSGRSSCRRYGAGDSLVCGSIWIGLQRQEFPKSSGRSRWRTCGRLWSCSRSLWCCSCCCNGILPAKSCGNPRPSLRQPRGAGRGEAFCHKTRKPLLTSVAPLLVRTNPRG